MNPTCATLAASLRARSFAVQPTATIRRRLADVRVPALFLCGALQRG